MKNWVKTAVVSTAPIMWAGGPSHTTANATNPSRVETQPATQPATRPVNPPANPAPFDPQAPVSIAGMRG